MRNPGEIAAQLEQAILEKTGSNASGGQYSIMTRKLVDHIRKNNVSLDECEDVQSLVN